MIDRLQQFLGKNKLFLLCKLSSKRKNILVPLGSEIKGEGFIVDVLGQPAILVRNSYDYIRTSPVIEIANIENGIMIFETQGGIYRLETL